MHYFKKRLGTKFIYLFWFYFLVSHYYVLNLIILRILYLMLAVMKFNNIKKKFYWVQKRRIGSIVDYIQWIKQWFNNPCCMNWCVIKKKNTIRNFIELGNIIQHFESKSIKLFQKISLSLKLKKWVSFSSN